MWHLQNLCDCLYTVFKQWETAHINKLNTRVEVPLKKKKKNLWVAVYLQNETKQSKGLSDHAVKPLGN